MTPINAINGNPILRSTRDQWRELMATIGYQLMHTWEQSHGNGGQDFYERLAPMIGCKARLLVVHFDRGGFATGVVEEEGNGSFLLAKDVLANVDGDWTKLSDNTWPCCTGGVSRWRFYDGHEVSVVRAAGHGVAASWEEMEPLVVG